MPISIIDGIGSTGLNDGDGIGGSGLLRPDPPAPPPAGCAYPLNDDGTVTAMFGLNFAPADAPDYQHVSYTLTEGGDAGTFADGAYGGGDEIALGSTIKAVEAVATVPSGDSISERGAGLILLWNTGAGPGLVRLFVEYKSSRVILFYGGANQATLAVPSQTDVVLGLYVDGSTGSVGWTVNGADQGATGATITAAYSPGFFIDDDSGSGLSGGVVDLTLRSSASAMTSAYPAGATDICGNAI